jgi:hypothetical protein
MTWRKLALGAAAAALASAGPASTPAVASPDKTRDIGVVPCDLPPDAVKAVPAPFDGYMELACNQGGQQLRPVDGFRWIADAGSIWLSAMNPDKPLPDPATLPHTVYFTRLETAAVPAEHVAALREALKALTKDPVILQSNVLKMNVWTSTGDRKQIYLLVPQVPPSRQHPVVGMECHTECLPIKDDPMFFEVRPLS